MKQIAESVLLFFDGMIMMFWGINTIELIGLVASGGIPSLVSNVESILKVLFSLVGLVYTSFRFFKEYDGWKIDKEIKKQDLREKILKNDDLENEKVN